MVNQIKTTRIGTTTSPKLEPVIPRQVYTKSAPLPFQPVPKTSGSNRFTIIELSNDELADKARRIAYLDSEIARHQSKINEHKRELGQVIGEIRLGTNPGVVEICEFCHERHEGTCNN